MKLIFLVIQIILALSLIGVVLLQRTSTDGLSGLSGGGSGNNIFSSRGSANFLTKTTSIIAILFMINCIILGNISSKELKTKSAFETVTKEDNNQPIQAPLAK